MAKVMAMIQIMNINMNMIGNMVTTMIIAPCDYH